MIPEYVREEWRELRAMADRWAADVARLRRLQARLRGCLGEAFYCANELDGALRRLDTLLERLASERTPSPVRR